VFLFKKTKIIKKALVIRTAIWLISVSCRVKRLTDSLSVNRHRKQGCLYENVFICESNEVHMVHLQLKK